MLDQKLAPILFVSAALAACSGTQANFGGKDSGPKKDATSGDAGPAVVLDAGSPIPDSGLQLPDFGNQIPDIPFQVPDSGGPGDDAGVQPTDSGIGFDAPPAFDSGPGDAGVTAITVANLIAGRMALSGQVVQIQNAVVVAAAGGTAGQNGSFYIQDNGQSGPGVMVFHSKNDLAPFPAVGNVISVTGRVTTFSGVFEISGSTAHMVTLEIVITGNGTAAGGAYSPAGMPIMVASTTGYAHGTANAHPEQVGNVLQFSGSLSVTNPRAFVSTNNDGGTRPEGFEVNGGLWVDDSFVYRDCIGPLDGGAIDLSRGIRGVWDRYQDFYAGSSANPAPTVPVLYPMSCADLSPP